MIFYVVIQQFHPQTSGLCVELGIQMRSTPLRWDLSVEGGATDTIAHDVSEPTVSTDTADSDVSKQRGENRIPCVSFVPRLYDPATNIFTPPPRPTRGVLIVCNRPLALLREAPYGIIDSLVSTCCRISLTTLCTLDLDHSYRLGRNK